MFFEAAGFGNVNKKMWPNVQGAVGLRIYPRKDPDVMGKVFHRPSRPSGSVLPDLHPFMCRYAAGPFISRGW